jgi:hypothetical protein
METDHGKAEYGDELALACPDFHSLKMYPLPLGES